MNPHHIILCRFCRQELNEDSMAHPDTCAANPVRRNCRTCDNLVDFHGGDYCCRGARPNSACVESCPQWEPNWHARKWAKEDAR